MLPELPMAAIVNGAMDAIISIDSDQKIVVFNIAAERMFRCLAKDALGQPIGRFIPECFDAAISVATLGGLRSDGEEFPLEASISQVEISGRTFLTAILRDATERMVQVQLAAIVEFSDDAIIGKDLAGRVTSWNPAAEKLFGYTAPEMLGATTTLLNPPDRQDEAAWILERIARGGSVEHLETTRVGKDGRAILVSITVSPIKNHAGHVTGCAMVTRDITERKRTESVLRASDERFRAFMDNIPSLVFIKDVQGRYVYLNKAIERFTHTPVSELLGKTGYERLPAAIAQRLSANDQRVLSSGQAEQFEETVPGFDGSPRHEVCIKFPLTDADGQRLLAGVAIDVTEQRQAEEERDRFFTMSLDTLCIVDGKGRFKRLNPAFSDALGFSEAELMTAPFLDFVHPEDRADALAALESLHNPVPAMGFESRCHCKDGSWKWLEWKITSSDEGLIYAMARDVTERKRADKALIQSRDDLEIRVEIRTTELAQTNNLLKGEIAERQMAMGALRETVTQLQSAKEEAERAKEEAERARREAERANAAKSEFLSRMSHELRTPMNSILGFAQIMEMQAIDEKQGQRVAHITKAGRHLLQLINEVLDMARVEAGQLSFSPEPVRIGSAIAIAVDLVRPLCQQNELHLEVETGERSELFVRADQQRLSQVLLNLLSNAIKYNRQRGQIRIYSERREQNCLRVCVSDTGIGIDPEKLSRLFEPFERLGADPSIEGTGLGLALSKRLVEEMGGKIGLDTTYGAGSTFWIELPLTEGSLKQLSDEPKSAPNLETTKSCKILYIEDNLDNLQVIEHVLQAYPQIELITAMQGQLGIDLAREHLPSLILLDLHLPDINGDEVLHRLQLDSLTRSIPVVMLSADASPNHINRLLNLGAAKYLTKPLDVRYFLEILDQILPQREP